MPRSPVKRDVPPREFRVPIIAQDPEIRSRGAVLLDHVEILNESCAPGPRGARVYVVDYDATHRKLYEPPRCPAFGNEKALREYEKRLGDPQELERKPALHAVNAYVTIMSVLGRFERALGRRIAWGFGGHQIHVAPHAFADANAYYSEEDHALLFGYFPSRQRGRGMVFSALSHDIVAHETTHALLDGLRDRYTDPSSPDQAAFHEAFADVAAILSVFSMRPAVEALLKPKDSKPTVRHQGFEGAWLRGSPLLAMAEQFGRALDGAPHRGALRTSLLLEPDPALYGDLTNFGEPHRRAEILVAAMLRAFVDMWKWALWGSRLPPEHPVPLDVVVTEGCELAERLLTMAIRAIDYAPVVDIQFPDFVRALVTADKEVFPRDDKYDARRILPAHFRAYGINADGNGEPLWEPPPGEDLRYDHIHPEALRHDPNEVFRFLWENRKPLELDEEAFTRVQPVRPCVRQGPDGFWLQETVCEYVQTLTLRARDFGSIQLKPRQPGARPERLRRPDGLEDDQEVTLKGGGVLLFDEFGKLKYHIGSGVRSYRQNDRLDALAVSGSLQESRGRHRHFAMLHRGSATRWARGIAPSEPAHGRKKPMRTEAW